MQSRASEARRRTYFESSPSGKNRIITAQITDAPIIEKIYSVILGIKSGGRVEGKMMLESTFKDMEASFYKSADQLLEELTKEVEL